MQEINIYIKSHFRGNPWGEGEAAGIVEYIDKNNKIHIRQHQVEVRHNTRNALHLKICIATVKILLKPCVITIFINSEYIKNTSKLLEKWQKEGWKKADGNSPANIEDWKQLYMLMQMHTIKFVPYCKEYDEELEKIVIGIKGN